MIHSKYRALIVDDEPLIRDITVRAMQRDKFLCDEAEDGEQALALLNSNRYDVIITDLRMPRRHGHSLVCSLLACAERPLIIVLTGVREARLAKDLYSRGVEEVEFKPVDYKVFPTKVKSLLDRRKTVANEVKSGPNAPNGQSNPNVASAARENSLPCPAVSVADLVSKLPLVSSILPISQTALDVFTMANSEQYDAKQITTAVGKEPSLAADVLRYANSSFYNPRQERIAELEEAIDRIGQNRVGELALATTALAAITAGKLSWMNVELDWRRSIAAGIAIDLLVAEGGHSRIQQGLFANAVMHSLGRVVLGTLYPKQYESMLEICRAEGRSLLELERQIFPESHAEVMERLLALWNIPADICHPLKYILDDYRFLARLSEPTRTKVELIKFAVLLGQIAVNRWESWDYLEFPTLEALQRLNITVIADRIDQVRIDLAAVAKPPFEHGESANPTGERSRQRQLAYCNLTANSFDVLEYLIASMGIKKANYPAGSQELTSALLVNATSVSARQITSITSQLQSSPATNVLIATNSTDEAGFRELGNTISLPCSYGSLQSACWHASNELNESDRDVSGERRATLNVVV